jgi:hypothetical protein
VKRFLPYGISVTALAIILSGALGGSLGAAGIALGMAATAASLGGWWPAIRMLGSVATVEGAGQSKIGGKYVVLIFLVKLPIFVGLGFLALKLGGAAPPCFLIGLGLVYFWLIGWSLNQEQRPE